MYISPRPDLRLLNRFASYGVHLRSCSGRDETHALGRTIPLAVAGLRAEASGIGTGTPWLRRVLFLAQCLPKRDPNEWKGTLLPAIVPQGPPRPAAPDMKVVDGEALRKGKVPGSGFSGRWLQGVQVGGAQWRSRLGFGCWSRLLGSRPRAASLGPRGLCFTGIAALAS